MLSKLIHAEIIRKLQGFRWPQEKWKLIICLHSLDIVTNQFLRTNGLRYDPEWYHCNKSDKKFKSSSIKNYECCLSKFIHDHSWHTIKWKGIGKRNRFRFYFLCFQKKLHCSLSFSIPKIDLIEALMLLQTAIKQPGHGLSRAKWPAISQWVNFFLALNFE